MKALVYEGPRQMNMRDIDVPVPEGDEVLIKVAFSGICGSELSGYLGHNSLRQPPLVFGHEFSGTIAELGPWAAGRFPVGQRVTGNPLVTCGNCRPCKLGKQQLCLNRKLLSASLPGCNATYVKVPSRFVYPLPDHVGLEGGAMVEPIACAVRVIELADVKPADSLLIVGMGPIGQLILQAARLQGVNDIIAVDLNEERLAMVKKPGVTTLWAKAADIVAEVRKHTGGYGANVSIDAVGAGITRNQCILSTAPGGTVIFTGLHEADSMLPINTMIRNETKTMGAFAYSSVNFETALRYIDEGRVGLHEGVVKVPLEEGPHWYERLLGNSGNVSKVLLCPSEE